MRERSCNLSSLFQTLSHEALFLWLVLCLSLPNLGCVGAVSEKFAQALNEYIEKNPDKLPILESKVDREKFRGIMCLKYRHSMVEAGEAVRASLNSLNVLCVLSFAFPCAVCVRACVCVCACVRLLTVCTPRLVFLLLSLSVSPPRR